MSTIQDTTKDPAAKAAAIELLTKGMATKSEVARLAGVSRQLVEHWAKDIPIKANRSAAVSALWRRALGRKR